MYVSTLYCRIFLLRSSRIFWLHERTGKMKSRISAFVSVSSVLYEDGFSTFSVYYFKDNDLYNRTIKMCVQRTTHLQKWVTSRIPIVEKLTNSCARLWKDSSNLYKSSINQFQYYKLSVSFSTGSMRISLILGDTKSVKLGEICTLLFQ